MLKKWRSKKHLKEVAELGCIICGKEACAHHITGHGDSGTGTKPSDALVMPLCHNHHTGRDGVHKVGVLAWESAYGSQWKMIAETLAMIKEGR